MPASVFFGGPVFQNIRDNGERIEGGENKPEYGCTRAFQNERSVVKNEQAEAKKHHQSDYVQASKITHNSPP